MRKSRTLSDFWDVKEVGEDGVVSTKDRNGFLFELEGIDGSFFLPEQLTSLHNDWRTVLRMSPGEELQVVYRKRVEFAKWVEAQLQQAFLSESTYGRRMLLDRLSNHVAEMSREGPRLLSQKIIACYWTNGILSKEDKSERQGLLRSQLSSFGFQVQTLNKKQVAQEINLSAQNLMASESEVPEWPSLSIDAGHVQIYDDTYRALELTKLPENFSELGMIQAITALPYPMDVCVRLRSRDIKPIVTQLERKRNLLQALRENKNTSAPALESQIEQIASALRSLAEFSEGVYDLQMTVGLRFPKTLQRYQRKALETVMRAGSQMDFCEFEETTLGTFDSYLECIPSFTGKNISKHTVLGSNALHFLPFFRPAKGDPRVVASFQTRSSSLYGIDPVDTRLANYNWLVSGTSGAGKSFFVNSLVSQSVSINPNIFIVDIGGSYNKLTQYLGGRVMSLEPGQGFEISPFFYSQSVVPSEERFRRQHVYQVFLEMVRVDGNLPSIEVRHLLSESLEKLFSSDKIPERPVTSLIDIISSNQTSEARRLIMLLEPWKRDKFFGQFLDNNKSLDISQEILTFDLKGLTEFEELSRVVQLIVCASVWAKIRQSGGQKFSWIILDEVAFSLLKTQPQFVDELVSTLRKYYGGAIIVVQDLEKITSNFAGSSILQNTQSKAILQQRGDPKNYFEALSLHQMDLLAIESLRRVKGSYSDVFLIRDNEKTVIRYFPSRLEYWLATTAPEDTQILSRWMEKSSKPKFQSKIDEFVASPGGGVI